MPLPLFVPYAFTVRTYYNITKQLSEWWHSHRGMGWNATSIPYAVDPSNPTQTSVARRKYTIPEVYPMLGAFDVIPNAPFIPLNIHSRGEYIPGSMFGKHSPTSANKPEPQAEKKVQAQDSENPNRGKCDGTAIAIKLYDFKDIVTPYYVLNDNDQI